MFFVSETSCFYWWFPSPASLSWPGNEEQRLRPFPKSVIKKLFLPLSEIILKHNLHKSFWPFPQSSLDCFLSLNPRKQARTIYFPRYTRTEETHEIPVDHLLKRMFFINSFFVIQHNLLELDISLSNDSAQDWTSAAVRLLQRKVILNHLIISNFESNLKSSSLGEQSSEGLGGLTLKLKRKKSLDNKY